MPLQLNDAMKEKIAALLPEGYSVENVRFMEGPGLLRTAASTEGDDELNIQVASAFKRAGGPPMISDNKPTIMRVVAWMAHVGVNKNRLAFTEEGLKSAATLITPQNPLVMDFNHRGVLQVPGEQRVIGHWYKAEYAFNPKAKKGKGAWGLLVTGVFFSWAFPEIAQALLADQARLGYIRFSMACISKKVEHLEDDEGRPYEIAHDPIFFTHSALDVPNADADANGVGMEGSGDPELEDKLARGLRADYGEPDEELLALVASLPDAEPVEPKVALDAHHEEAGMTEAEKQAMAALETAKAEADKKIAELTTELASTNEKLTAATEQLTAATEKVAAMMALEVQVQELSTAKEGLATEFTALQARVAEQDALIAEFKKKDEEEKEKEAKREAAEKLTARIASLPESYRTAHSKKDAEKRELVEAKWSAMSDEEWDFYRAEELLAGVDMKVGYVQRTADLPYLPNAGEVDKSIKDRIAKVKK